MEIIRLNPVFKQVVWGGSRMRDEFGYDIPGYDTGECWAVSAHKNGDCVIASGEYAGHTLSWLWENKQEMFANAGHKQAGKSAGTADDSELPVFPLLTKIIDARDNLSIQVHPDDTYAREHENGSLGKTECWYILDADPGTSIVIGHNAKTHEELEEMIRKGRWDEFIREIPVKKGDFLQIYPGTVHAIKGGTMILETQQNSDITYRVYDYGRLQNGKPRQLHVEQSIAVIKVPFNGSEALDKGEALVSCGETDGVCTSLIRCDYYKVWKIDTKGTASYEQKEAFMLCSVIDGSGTITVESDCACTGKITENVNKGEHFILPADVTRFSLSGNMSLICSSI